MHLLTPFQKKYPVDFDDELKIGDELKYNSFDVYHMK